MIFITVVKDGLPSVDNALYNPCRVIPALCANLTMPYPGNRTRQVDRITILLSSMTPAADAC
jgi:hypothetical protein